MANYEVKAELVIDDKMARKALLRMHRSLRSLSKQIDRVNRKFSRLGTMSARASRMGAPGAMGGYGRGMRRAPKPPDRASMSRILAPDRRAAQPAPKAGGAAAAAAASRGRHPGGGAYLGAAAAAGAVFLMGRALANQVAAASEFRKEMEMGRLGLATMFNLVDKMPLDAALSRASEQMIKFNVLAAEAPGSGQDIMQIYSRLYAPMAKLGVAAREVEDSVKGVAVMGKAMGIKDIGALGRDIEEMLTGRAGRRTTKVFALANAWGLINMEAREFNALAPEKRLEITNKLIDRFTKHGERMARTWEGASEAFGGWYNIVRDFAGKGLFDELGRQLYDLNQQIERNLPQIRGYMGLAGGKLATGVGAASTVGGATAQATGLSGIVIGEAALGGGLLAMAAAVAALTAMLVSIVAPTGTVATFASFIFTFFGIGPFIMAVVGAVATLIAIFQVFTDHAGTLGKFFGTVLGGVLGMVVRILSSAFWALVSAIKVVVLVVASALVPVFRYLLMPTFLVLGSVVLFVVEVIRVLVDTFYAFLSLFSGGAISNMSDELSTMIQDMQLFTAIMVRGFSEMFAVIAEKMARALESFAGSSAISSALFSFGALQRRGGQDAYDRIMGMKFGFGEGDDKDPLGKKGIKGSFQAPAQINVQRMIINQDFKGKADPDRVVTSFMKAITNQADAAMSSPVDVTRGT